MVLTLCQTNDTLDDKMCPQAGKSTKVAKAWVNVFAPAIADRINAVAPGAKLKKKDVVNLMSLCPFDTVAHEAPSPWCDLFTPEEWTSYEYHGDLTDYYGNGWVCPVVVPARFPADRGTSNLKIWTGTRARSRRWVRQRAACSADGPTCAR